MGLQPVLLQKFVLETSTKASYVRWKTFDVLCSLCLELASMMMIMISEGDKELQREFEMYTIFNKCRTRRFELLNHILD